MRNPFDILNVTPQASKEDIRKAYLNLAKIFHPDTFQGNPEAATERMQELNWAYKVLNDPIQRKFYERQYYADRAHQEQKKQQEQETDTQTKQDNEKAAQPKAKKKRGFKWAVAAALIVLVIAVPIIMRNPSPKSKGSAETSQTISEESGITVYVTDTGTKYHRSGCSYLSKSKHAIDLDEAIAEGYSRCSRCNPPKEE